MYNQSIMYELIHFPMIKYSVLILYFIMKGTSCNVICILLQSQCTLNGRWNKAQNARTLEHIFKS